MRSGVLTGVFSAVCAVLVLNAPVVVTLAFGQTKSVALKAVDASDPNTLIDSTANIMISELDGRRVEFRKDPSKVSALVERVLFPHFDVEHAARLVVGRHWRAATSEQRERFIDAFYGSLLSNYGDALIEFTGDRIKVLPSPIAADAISATVRTEIKRSNGQKIPVNYTLRKTEAGWKVWDVVIEGISYVKSFREDLGSEIEQKGLDAVIARLEVQNRAVQSGGSKPSGSRGAPL
ncbi:MAG: ABC transporter substrate-binding protein [Gammaproteobacteria bacterium]|nr:ABC transporter substrate-binding protein [Gammaproteobacteria bacterium]